MRFKGLKRHIVFQALLDILMIRGDPEVLTLLNAVCDFIKQSCQASITPMGKKVLSHLVARRKNTLLPYLKSYLYH